MTTNDMTDDDRIWRLWHTVLLCCNVEFVWASIHFQINQPDVIHPWRAVTSGEVSVESTDRRRKPFSCNQIAIHYQGRNCGLWRFVLCCCFWKLFGWMWTVTACTPLITVHRPCPSSGKNKASVFILLWRRISNGGIRTRYLERRKLSTHKITDLPRREWMQLGNVQSCPEQFVGRV
jgi:hypothetical protein